MPQRAAKPQHSLHSDLEASEAAYPGSTTAYCSQKPVGRATMETDLNEASSNFRDVTKAGVNLLGSETINADFNAQHENTP